MSRSTRIPTVLLAIVASAGLSPGCAAQEPAAEREIVEEPLAGTLGSLAGGYLVRPRSADRRPLVVLSHGRHDLADDLQDLADRLAGRGYVSFVRPPFLSSMRADDLGALRGVLTRLKEAPWVDPARVALVGFCGGGYQSLLLASQRVHDLAAVVSFYGPLNLPEQFQPEEGPRFQNLFETVDHIRVPVQGHYGDADEVIPTADARRLARMLAENDREADVFVYEGARHGFCDHTHGHYDEATCRLATRRMFEFLAIRLGGVTR